MDETIVYLLQLRSGFRADGADKSASPEFCARDSYLIITRLYSSKRIRYVHGNIFTVL